MRRQSGSRSVTVSNPMYSEITNLLPSERRRALIYDYVLRLGVVLLIFITMLTFTAAALLLPTYILFEKSITTKKAQVAAMESKLSSAEEDALSARLSVLSASVEALSTLKETVSASVRVRSVLAVSRPGITISSISYTPLTTIRYKNSVGKVPGTIELSGTAATRDALRSYQLALQREPFVVLASLPVSAYAQDKDIGFVITITLSL